jgi:hypothetical protein
MIPSGVSETKQHTFSLSLMMFLQYALCAGRPMSPRSSRLHILCFTLILAIASVLQADPLVGDLSLLTKAADAAEQNYAKLHTWIGSATWTTISQQAGVDYGNEVKVQFLCDHDHDAVRWHSIATGTLSSRDKTPQLSIGMLWQNNVYRLQRYATDQPRPKYLELMIEARPPAPQNPINPIFVEFSPLCYYPQLNLDTPTALRWYKQNATDPNLTGGTITEDGDLIILNIQGKDGVINRYEFSKSQACALTRILLKDSRGEEVTTTQFVKNADVFVPSSFLHTHADYADPQGKPHIFLTEKVDFTSSAINQPIPAKTFRLQSLEIQDGDTIVDNPAGIDYTHHTPIGPPSIQAEDLSDQRDRLLSTQQKQWQVARSANPLLIEAENRRYNLQSQIKTDKEIPTEQKQISDIYTLVTTVTMLNDPTDSAFLRNAILRESPLDKTVFANELIRRFPELDPGELSDPVKLWDAFSTKMPPLKDRLTAELLDLPKTTNLSDRTVRQIGSIQAAKVRDIIYTTYIETHRTPELQETADKLRQIQNQLAHLPATSQP